MESITIFIKNSLKILNSNAGLYISTQNEIHDTILHLACLKIEKNPNIKILKYFYFYFTIIKLGSMRECTEKYVYYEYNDSLTKITNYIAIEGKDCNIFCKNMYNIYHKHDITTPVLFYSLKCCIEKFMEEIGLSIESI